MDAYAKRNPPYGLIFHRDKGVNFTASAIRALLESYEAIIFENRHAARQQTHGIIFATLKKELYRKTYCSPEEFFQSIKDYTEYYNNLRLHSRLDYKTPKRSFG